MVIQFEIALIPSPIVLTPQSMVLFVFACVSLRDQPLATVRILVPSAISDSVLLYKNSGRTETVAKKIEGNIQCLT